MRLLTEFPFFLNWQNRAHIERLADLWKVDILKIPHWHLHAHAMEIFRHAETGSVKFLWILATNPAVSLPELHRIRKILGKPDLFVVVQDAFMTETAKTVISSCFMPSLYVTCFMGSVSPSTSL